MRALCKLSLASLKPPWANNISVLIVLVVQQALLRVYQSFLRRFVLAPRSQSASARTHAIRAPSQQRYDSHIDSTKSVSLTRRAPPLRRMEDGRHNPHSTDTRTERDKNSSPKQDARTRPQQRLCYNITTRYTPLTTTETDSPLTATTAVSTSYHSITAILRYSSSSNQRAKHPNTKRQKRNPPYHQNDKKESAVPPIL